MDKGQVAEKISAIINPDGNNLQVSERTINETLDTLMPLVGEEESIEDFVSRVKPIFESIAGNLRKEKSDFAKSYEDKSKSKKDENDGEDKGEEEDDTEDNEEKGNDTMTILKTLMEEIKDLKESNNKRERNVSAEMTKKELASKASKLYPPSIIEVASMGFDFSDADAGSKFESKLGSVAGVLNIKPSNQKADTEPDFSEFFKEGDGNESFKNL